MRRRIGKSWGQGFLEGFLAVNGVGQSRGLVVAWNETMFSKDLWKGRFVVTVKLKRHRDDLAWVLVSVYGPVSETIKDSVGRVGRRGVSFLRFYCCCLGAI